VALAEVPADPLAPRSVPDEVVDALLRAAGEQPEPFLRARDLAALSLLAYAGLRVQEVCDLQLRDVDLPGASVTVRRGKGGKARRVPLHPDAIELLESYLTNVRYPAGLPAVGTDEEREALLLGKAMAQPGRPLRPGLTPSLIRHRLRRLRQRAAGWMRQAAERESDLLRADQLRQAAELLDHVSPHQLRHSLARRMLRTGAQLSEVQRVLGHSRLSTTGVYLTPSADDLRESIRRAGL
jgi:integrase